MSGDLRQLRDRANTKRERIVFLLDHYVDTMETMGQSGEGSSDWDGGEGVALMPPMYHHPSVRELRRAIERARMSEPGAVAHTMAYYTSEWRNTTHTITRRSKKGRMQVSLRVRQRIVPRWIVSRQIIAGVDAITAAFRGEVFIPSELMDEAA